MKLGNRPILKLGLSVLLVAAFNRAYAADYIISASPDGSASFSVDDDLDVYLNGTLVYTDGVAESGTRAPIDLQ